MTNDKGIFIKNIYYMLSYAFRVLKQTNYDEIASEEFEKIQDLFAAILVKGVSQQLKQGLYREYITKNETIPMLRGKLNLAGTIKNQIQHKRILTCEYDELSENNRLNQILKTTMLVLIKDSSVKPEYRTDLKKIMLYFDTVDVAEPVRIRWDMLHFQRNNKTYEMLINLCYFVLDGMLQTDVFLRLKDVILIIDTKYYGHTMQKRYDKSTLHSKNLYQIFAYVKNQDRFNTGKVSGMVLYAKTNEAVTPDCEFSVSGNRISVKTLDLNTEFQWIAKQLDAIAESYFGKHDL